MFSRRLDAGYTMITPHAFSKTAARNDDSDDSLHGMTICAN